MIESTPGNLGLVTVLCLMLIGLAITFIVFLIALLVVHIEEKTEERSKKDKD